MPKILISANTDWFLFNFRAALARSLQDSGFEVLLVSPAGEYAPKLTGAGFSWVRWDLGRKTTNPLKELGSLASLFRLYRQQAPDIVHHHTIKPVLYGSLAARLARVPLVVNSITGRGYVYTSKELKARLLKGFVDIFYKFVLGDHHIAVIFENQLDHQYFIDAGFLPTQRAWLIEGVGVDPEKFFPTPEPDGVPVVLMPGRMLWDKGVGVLVEAARLFKSQVEARVVLVGQPDRGNPASISEDVLEAWQADGIVEWWGWRAEMPPVYQQSHIVVLPTMYGEGVPTTLIEGAASGRPLVATDTTGCLSVVKQDQNGFLVPPDDPEALAQALQKLISDPGLRRKMGGVSREIFLEKFTHDKINAATLEVYKHLFKLNKSLKP
jgi:glycosyltransferase involved in cell wall biosynthesis